MKTTGKNYETVSRRPAVLVDFDSTAAEQNVAELLLKRFGDATWQDELLRLRSGELTLNEYQEITFRNIQAKRPEMQDYVKQHANLRPFFGELWSYCRSHDIPMAIVSQGLDFYIEALLEKEGCAQVPVYAVNTRFTPQGLTYEYHHLRSGEERQGVSKGLVVDTFRDSGHFVFYAGDGLGDFEGASRSDMVFAHRALAEKCTLNNIPFRPFTDFQDMLEALREYHTNGQQSVSSSNKPVGHEESSR